MLRNLTKWWQLCCHKKWHRNLNAHLINYSLVSIFLLKGNSTTLFNNRNDDLENFKGLRNSRSFSYIPSDVFLGNKNDIYLLLQIQSYLQLKVFMKNGRKKVFNHGRKTLKETNQTWILFRSNHLQLHRCSEFFVKTFEKFLWKSSFLVMLQDTVLLLFYRRNSSLN